MKKIGSSGVLNVLVKERITESPNLASNWFVEIMTSALQVDRIFLNDSIFILILIEPRIPKTLNV